MMATTLPFTRMKTSAWRIYQDGARKKAFKILAHFSEERTALSLSLALLAYQLSPRAWSADNAGSSNRDLINPGSFTDSSSRIVSLRDDSARRPGTHGTEVMIAPITLAWLLPSNARLPVAIS